MEFLLYTSEDIMCTFLLMGDFWGNNGQKNYPRQGLETIRDSYGDNGTARFNESGGF